METGTATTRVLICEDDYLVREGARAVLAVEGIEVLGTAEEPEGLLALLADHEPDAVVVDIRMPPTFTTEGIDLALHIRATHPRMGVVVLSQHADPEYALMLLRDGSNGLAYLLKERLGDADRLVGAIKEVCDGGSVLDPKIVDALLQAQRRRSASRLAGLTPREMEVLALMASGKGNAAIAGTLVITERAVEKHTNSIFHKLGLSETLELNRRVAAVLFFLQRSHD
ncbi:MAG: response regulator transcription factor [Egibacteraceae bacterium]